MKKTILLLLFIPLFFSCSSDYDDSVPYYTIEGKWLWSPDPDDRTYANTMYEYVDGIRYTYYPNCWPELCTDDDFNALDESDRIPGTDSYIWDEDTQSVLDDDGNSSVVTFECDGGIMYFPNGGKLWRLSSNCE